MWAQTKGTGLSERISYGGVGVAGFALRGPGDPAATLSDADQKWVMNALNDLNTKIIATNGAPCATWAPNLNAMVGCFQGWYNVNISGPSSGAAKMLRTDANLDQDTLDAIKMVVSRDQSNFPSAPMANAPAGTAAKPPMSKMVKGGLVAGAVVVVGGVAYVLTRKKGR